MGTGSDRDRSDAPPFAGLDTITGGENLLILVAAPGDETLACGGLIAALCRRGRAPFVMVLGDGTEAQAADPASDETARRLDRETREAVRALGLPPERLLLAGVYGGAIPDAGPLFEAVVRAVTLVMWARDCNVICAPWPGSGPAGQSATFTVAAAVAQTSGVGLLAVAPSDEAPLPRSARRFDVTGQMAAKRAAIAAHTLQRADHLAEYEVYLSPPVQHDTSRQGQSA